MESNKNGAAPRQPSTTKKPKNRVSFLPETSMHHNLDAVDAPMNKQALDLNANPTTTKKQVTSKVDYSYWWLVEMYF